VTVSESQLHSDVDAATGAVDGEAAEMIDETPGFADEPVDDEAATEATEDEAGAEPAEAEAPTEEDALAEFMR